MNGKNISIPFGMVFKKYYCFKCGTRLVKERTHRVVTKDDKDYYQFHDYNMFPRVAHDVYSYRFKCPSCKARISFDEQCIIERIQKKFKSKALSSNEIKDNYKEFKEKNNKRVLIRNIVIPFVFILLAFTIFYLVMPKTRIEGFIAFIIFFIITNTITIISEIKHYKGTHKLRYYQSHSFNKESLMEKLHAYSSHNKELIKSSNNCYCFYCKSTILSSDINDYIDEGNTALCPNCGIDSIIPDSVNEVIDEQVLDDMNKYWF